jgi:hypothetical protein
MCNMSYSEMNKFRSSWRNICHYFLSRISLHIKQWRQRFCINPLKSSNQYINHPFQHKKLPPPHRLFGSTYNSHNKYQLFLYRALTDWVFYMKHALFFARPELTLVCISSRLQRTNNCTMQWPTPSPASIRLTSLLYIKDKIVHIHITNVYKENSSTHSNLGTRWRSVVSFTLPSL